MPTRPIGRRTIARGLVVILLAATAPGPTRADEPAGRESPLPRAAVEPRPGGGVDLPSRFDPAVLRREATRWALSGIDWYRRTPPGERVCWGGLAACAGLGLVVLAERLARLRRRRIVPLAFTARFVDRLHEGRLDAGKALDYCEMNPSPAARVALAAVRRWGRPAADLERAVALAHRVEAERLRRNVGTLRRIAVLGPMLGLLGTLLAVARVLASAAGPIAPPGPALGAALSPLTAGLALATLALVAYDALATRIERLAGALDRLGAEAIDAIAVTTAPPVPSLPAVALQPHAAEPRPGAPHRPPAIPRRGEEAGRRRPRGDLETGF